jgi:hypothetical protein
LRIQDGRAQVGEQVQFGTDLQQAALRTDRAFDGVPLRTADGGQQHGVGLAGGFQGLVGQRHAVGVDGAAAQQFVAPAEAEVEAFVDLGEDFLAFGHDFRADAVAGEDDNVF